MLLSRASSKFSYTAAYTWSKALGIRGGGQGADDQPAGDIRDRRLRRPRATTGAHVLNIGYSYLFPSLDDAAALKKALLGGWQFTGRLDYISGAPLQPPLDRGRTSAWPARPPTGADPVGNTAITGSPQIAAMPVLTCDPREGVSGDQSAQPELLRAADAGLERELHLPGPARPGYRTTTSRVFKNFPMGGSRKFQFRASFTNVFNHPQRFLDDNTNLQAELHQRPAVELEVRHPAADNKYGRRIVQLAFKMYSDPQRPPGSRGPGVVFVRFDKPRPGLRRAFSSTVAL